MEKILVGFIIGCIFVLVGLLLISKAASITENNYNEKVKFGTLIIENKIYRCEVQK